MKKAHQIGHEMHHLCRDLFPICRSLAGLGFRQSLNMLKQILPDLCVHSIPTGTTCFDWTVPKEWHIQDAYIITPTGDKICSFAQSNLHVVSYSIPSNLMQFLTLLLTIKKRGAFVSPMLKEKPYKKAPTKWSLTHLCKMVSSTMVNWLYLVNQKKKSLFLHTSVIRLWQTMNSLVLLWRPTWPNGLQACLADAIHTASSSFLKPSALSPI